MTPQQLRVKLETVEQIDYTIDEPITVIFDAVKYFVEIVELSGRPYSADQIDNIGYTILSKNRIFHSDIQRWMRRLEEEKTWLNFVLTFTEAN